MLLLKTILFKNICFNICKVIIKLISSFAWTFIISLCTSVSAFYQGYCSTLSA